MKVRSVPDAVTRQQVADLLAAIGIDPEDVPRGATLTLGPSALTIEVYARDEAGQLYPSTDGTTAAMHRISIPVDEGRA